MAVILERKFRGDLFRINRRERNLHRIYNQPWIAELWKLVYCRFSGLQSPFATTLSRRTILYSSRPIVYQLPYIPGRQECTLLINQQ